MDHDLCGADVVFPSDPIQENHRYCCFYQTLQNWFDIFIDTCIIYDENYMENYYDVDEAVEEVNKVFAAYPNKLELQISSVYNVSDLKSDDVLCKKFQSIS